MGLATLLRPRICELGKIKIGGKEEQVRKTKSGGEWRAPCKYDHFVLTTMNRNAKGDLIRDETLMGSLGEKFADGDGQLRQVPITLLSDDIEDCMQSAWVWYDGKRIGGRSDGERLTWFVNPKSKEVLDAPRVVEWKPEYAEMGGGKMWKLHTVFNCVVTAGDARFGGVYKFRTTSRITADQLYGSLLHLQQLTSGVLRGLPLRLVVRPMQVAPEGKPTTVYVVHVELRGPDLQAIQQQALQMAQFRLGHAKEMQRTQVEFRKLLQAPGEGETEDEIQEITEEFHPGAEIAAVTPPTEADPLAAEMGLGDDNAPASGDTFDAVTGEIQPGECACPDGPAGQHEDGCAEAA